MPTAQVNGVKLNYLQIESRNQNAPEELVMVHGLATSLAFWYLHYANAFSQRFRVTLVDMRGHGRSEMPACGYTPKNLAIDLQMFLDHVEIETAHIVAHSFGGVVSLNLSLMDPDRVASLILADTHLSAIRDKRDQFVWAHGSAIERVLHSHGLLLDSRDPYFGYKLLTAVAELQLENAEVPDALLDLIRPLMAGGGKQTAKQWLKLMRTTAAENELMGHDGLTLEALQTLNIPILAMYGDRSQAMMTGEHLLNVWPHAEFRRVLDAGHFFPALKPNEVKATCSRFWDGEFMETRRFRAGETGRAHFRSDRLFQKDGAWFCTTRESPSMGPFADVYQAQSGLAAHIAQHSLG